MSTSSVVTLQSLITAAQQRSDLVNSNFITTSEWTTYINGSWKELYDLLVGAYGNDYFASTYSFTTDGVNQLFPLPTDFYKLLGVDLMLGNSAQSPVTLKPFTFSERNRYSVPNFQSFYGVTNLRYRINGSNIWLTPLPTGGQQLQLWYVPEPTSLVNLTDTMDGIAGWEEYVIVDACIKALNKDETDATAFMKQKADMKARLEDMAQNRDAGSPATVADSQAGDMWWPNGAGNGYGGMV